MATYDSLTDEQKKDLAIYDTAMRGAVSSAVGITKAIDAASLATFGKDRVDPIMATLDDGEVVPNSTNLGSAKDITALEYKALQVIIRGVLKTLNDNRSLIVKAIGINA